jgi:predicted DNA-binding antitoxin AbrB/MazE fold protein
MTRTIDAIYDGQVLRPLVPLDLQPNERCRITIESQTPSQAVGKKIPRCVREILEMAEDLGVPDLAQQHDHYLYGLPKR